MAIIDSYSESNYSGNVYLSTADYYAQGQSFTGDGSTLGSAVFYICKEGSPTGSIYAKIYAHSGTFGTNSVGTGSALATSDAIDVSTLPASSNANKTFTFSGAEQITLTNGTKYVVVAYYTGGDASNYVSVGCDRFGPTHAGNICRWDGAVWYGHNVYDACFYVYSVGSSPSLSPSRSVSLTPSLSISLSPSSTASPSASASLSPSTTPSTSASPSAAPVFGTYLRVAKSGINALTNSDPEKMKFDSAYGTLKYYTKQTKQVTFTAGAPNNYVSGSATYTHSLGYYPFTEVFVRVYIGSPSGNYEYCPFFGSGASVAYSANYKITTSDIVVYGSVDGVSSSTWVFDFLIFVYKNDLSL